MSFDLCDGNPQNEHPRMTVPSTSSRKKLTHGLFHPAGLDP
jgi:hypothetical protein